MVFEILLYKVPLGKAIENKRVFLKKVPTNRKRKSS